MKYTYFFIGVQVTPYSDYKVLKKWGEGMLPFNLNFSRNMPNSPTKICPTLSIALYHITKKFFLGYLQTPTRASPGVRKEGGSETYTPQI